MRAGFGLLLMSMMLACTPESSRESAITTETASSGTLSIYTVNYPLAYMADRIVGSRGDVSFPAPPDVDPATWSPGPETIIDYQQADLILLNGAGYAAWVTNASLPRSRLVDTTARIADRLIPIESSVTHSHGPTGDHSHSGTAFTTWLDLEIRTRPKHEEEFRQAFTDLEAEFRDIDTKLVAATKRLDSQPVLFSHPVYQYFERRYKVNGYAVHWEPDALPVTALWVQLKAVLREHPAKIMIWESDPLPETRRRLMELGIVSVVMRPGGNKPAEGDLLDLLQKGIAALEGATKI
jgi:zinc transport system substrate-binding protein